ncbi:MAG TPA: hypothetical protein VHB73_05815 [Alphaproteobacteria bacterium]|nr:hypothetical protein [Alphaproteobacteria bacterium]
MVPLMIFPVRLSPPASPARFVRRASLRMAEAVEALVPVEARFLPRQSFAARLLDVGLRHNIPELVRKAEDGVAPRLPAPEAVRAYEQAQGGFVPQGPVSLYSRFAV